MLRQAFNIVIKFLKEYFPSLSTSTGVVRDLFAKAFALLYYQEIEDINNMLDNMDIRNYETMPEEALDRIGRMFLLERNLGQRASTVVTIYVPVPVSVFLPAGWLFTTYDGFRFASIRDVSVSISQMTNNMLGSSYYFDIPVQAYAEGTGYNVAAGAISSSVTSLPFRVTSIRNNQACSNGADREDNTEFYQRIVESANTRDLIITDASAATVVLAAFPSLRSVDVVGAGEALMERDIVFGIMMPEGFNPYERESYFGKKKGVVRYNKNIAYKGSLESITLPTDPDDLELEEYAQADYEDLFAKDLEYVEQRGGLIWGDEFDPPGGDTFISILNIFDLENWIASDSGFPFGTRKLGTSVRLYDGMLILGATNVELTSVPI